MASPAKFDADRVCRICLCEVGEFYFIYDETPVEHGANISQILEECTRYSCERYDKLPHQMCSACIKDARQAYRFKRRAEESYRTLVTMLGRTPLLKQHSNNVYTQTEQIPLLPCELCNDKFLNSTELRLHRKRQHKELNADAFKCKLCSKNFGQLRHLRTHLAEQHQQQLPLMQMLQCRICTRSFSRRDHLLRHVRNIHQLGEKRRVQRAKITEKPVEQATAWAHEEQQPAQSIMPSDLTDGDELESAAVMFNEQDINDDNADDYQCNTNPISSNEESDGENLEAKQALWLNIKPEPSLGLEASTTPSATTTSTAVTLNDSANTMESKPRRTPKQSTKSDKDDDEEEPDAEEATPEINTKVKDEPLCSNEHLQIKTEQEQIQLDAEDQETAYDEEPVLSDEFGDDDDDIDGDNEDEDEDDGEFVHDEASMEANEATDVIDEDGELKARPPKVEIVREYLQKKSNKQRRRRRNQNEPNPENRCDICQRTFSRHCHLLRHKLSHLEKKPHNCPHCPKAFARSDHLKAHVQSLHSNKEHKCGLCEAAFARPDALERHKVSKHNGEGLDANSELKLHTCEYCAKRFSSKTYLRKHTLLHTDFLYACKSCDETFKERQQLREHEKTHTGQRNFLCCICGDSFARNDYLRVHMRRHNGEKPYKCHFCVKAFPRATDLKVHERYHTNTKPNLCNTCGKSFHRAYNLTIHMRTHTGERPYKCDQCPKSFTQSNDLKAHIRRHTGERYKCPHCDAYFLQLYNMRNHCLSAHNKHIETKTGRLQRTGLLDDGSQTHLTPVVMPPPRYQSQPLDIPITLQQQQQQSPQQQQLPTATAIPVIHSPLSYNAGNSSAVTTTTTTLVDGSTFVNAATTTAAATAAAAAAPFATFSFTPAVMALMYNSSQHSQNSQQSNASGSSEAGK